MLNIKANIADTKKVLSIYIMIINVAIDLKKQNKKLHNKEILTGLLVFMINKDNIKCIKILNLS